MNEKYNSIMMKNIILMVENIVWGPQFLIMFIALGIYLTIKLKVPQIKTLTVIFKIKGNKQDKITPFNALMTILAGTLGIGNITGVATAIAIGGIGSIFWIFVSGIIAMPISYAENYLVLKYRKNEKRKGFFGGAMYVLDEVLDKKLLGILFAIFTLIATIGMGAMVQSNSLTQIIVEEYRISKTVVAIVVATISGYIIFGGKRKMAKLNSYVIPLCTAVYVILCGMVIFSNLSELRVTIESICKAAFGLKQVAGGVIGVGIIQCMSVGFSRGMFSNEAGMGSAPIFSATTEEIEDVKTTAYAMSYSVFVDTLLLCVLTGITIVISGSYKISNTAIMLSMTFGKIPFGELLLTFCIIVFAVATVPCWEFYGEEAIRYLVKKEYVVYIYMFLYIICVYFGCVLSLDIVWSISNTANALMALPNIYMIFALRNKIQS